jgi:5-formyltetrahydrofolate cyclo-ligase
MNGEPGTGPLLDGLRAAGKRVILPVLLPDGDLDWAAYRSPDDLAPARLGLLEPTGERLGLEAVATADVVLVPALAVSPTGARLGRGGGSYDRALGRVPVGTFTCALLYDGEVGVDVPVEPHDRPVTHAVSPAGLRPLR